jgi:probable phosphoglycerate mutase
MTLVLLVRHAHIEWIGRGLAGRTPAVSLSARGVREAAALAERLRRVPLTALYASPLERAQETARAIASGRGLEPARSDALNEFDFGEWSGLSMAELAADDRWHAFNTRRAETRAPGGESMREVQRRVVAEIERWRERHPLGTVAGVSHGDTIRAALLHYAAMDIAAYHRLEVEPASVSAIALDGGGARIVRLNDTGLPPGAAP